MVKKVVLYDIRLATGVAIMLVVIGHLASRGQEGIDVYVNLKSLIYKFHMPLFLFLSGYISGYTYKKIKNFKEYIVFVKKKFLRLFPAYLLLSIIFLLGKYILGSSNSMIDGLANILFSPSSGNSGFLWYIYVLFLYNLIMPLIIFTVKNYFFIFFLLATILSLFTFPDILSLNFFFWYLPFFMLGCFLSNHIEKYSYVLSKIGFLSFILFVLWSVLEYLQIIDIPKILVGFLSILSVHYICLFFIKRNKFFELLGSHSFNIYLFNSVFMGGVTFILNKILGSKLYIDLFYIIAPFMVFIGIYLSILLYRIVEKRFPLLSKYIH